MRLHGLIPFLTMSDFGQTGLKEGGFGLFVQEKSC
jgi:hypothetical protein